MRTRALLAALLLVLPFSGCFDFLGRGLADHDVARTPVSTSDWNTGGVFTVQVQDAEPVQVDIKATSSDGRVITASGLSSSSLPPVQLAIPDGTWTIRYDLDGDKWETFKSARFDSTPPAVTGLATLGDAVDGAYTIGQGATTEPGASVRVIRQDTGAQVSSSLPARVTGLADGIHAFDVILTDDAGNQLVEQVQVRSGSASQLPAGKNTLGLVARYTLNAEVWDIDDLDTWMTPAQARSAVGNDWLGSGRAIAPDDPAVQQVVASEVAADLTTGQAAFALFRWMSDNLEYDHARLSAKTLLLPHQVIGDSEDASAAADADDDGDGFVPDGAGNGVRGGVCRDLAAVYVSLLRAAGVPARLVTGYLGGEVDGFHAWVEFYGGDGHGASPWVPVDVSAVGSSLQAGEQGYEAEVALQAFGLRHTDMLPLRVVTESQEQGSWSTAVAIATKFPAGDEPDIELAKGLTPQFTVTGTLCVDPATLARLLIPQDDADDCPNGYTHGVPGFVRSASHVLDYGARVKSAAEGTTVTLTLSYPEPAAVSPGQVEQLTYCAPSSQCGSFEKDGNRGVTVGVWAA